LQLLDLHDLNFGSGHMVYRMAKMTRRYLLMVYYLWRVYAQCVYKYTEFVSTLILLYFREYHSTSVGLLSYVALLSCNMLFIYLYVCMYRHCR